MIRFGTIYRVRQPHLLVGGAPCERDYGVSWEKRDVDDAGEHTIVPWIDAAVEDVYFQEENAEKKLEVGNLQIIEGP